MEKIWGWAPVFKVKFLATFFKSTTNSYDCTFLRTFYSIKTDPFSSECYCDRFEMLPTQHLQNKESNSQTRAARAAFNKILVDFKCLFNTVCNTGKYLQHSHIFVKFYMEM